MRNLFFSIALLIISCSTTDNPLDADNKSGTLSLNIHVVDIAGQVSALQAGLKDKLRVTIFDQEDKAVKSWDDLHQLPDKISLASGLYYVIVETKETVPSGKNVLSHYAKTELIHISENLDQDIALTFDSFIPSGFSDFSFD